MGRKRRQENMTLNRNIIDDGWKAKGMNPQLLMIRKFNELEEKL
jgi:hypothetical protein